MKNLLLGLVIMESAVCFWLFSKYLSQQRCMEELRVSADMDKMTGVFNKEAGLKYLENQLKACRKNRDYLTVCFIDVNNLKDINDTYGHMEGDMLIKKICQIIRSSLRKSDILFRFGGDEFIIVFPKCTLEEAEGIWKRIEKHFYSINSLEKKNYFLSVSHGFSVYDPNNERDLEELIRWADRKMYKHKQAYKKAEISRQSDRKAVFAREDAFKRGCHHTPPIQYETSIERDSSRLHT